MKKLLLIITLIASVFVYADAVTSSGVTLSQIIKKGYEVYDTGVIVRCFDEDERMPIIFECKSNHSKRREGTVQYQQCEREPLPRTFWEGESIYVVYRKGYSSTYYLLTEGRLYEVER